MKKVQLLVAILVVALCVGCSEKSSTTTTVEDNTKGIAHTTWECLLSTNTLRFIFTSDSEFQFTDEYEYNGKPTAVVAHGTYIYSSPTLKLTFTDSTGQMPGNQSCTVSGNQFKYGGHTFVKK